MSKELERRAKRAVKDIITDLADRRGLGQEWDAIDADIKREIVRGWVAVVSCAFEELIDA